MNMKRVATVLMMIVMAVGTSSVLAARKHAPEPEIQLTDVGQKLEAQYTREMEQLKSEITSALPKVDPAKIALHKQVVHAENGARAKLAEAQKGMADVNKGRGLVAHAKGKWIGGADKGIAKSKQEIKDAKTDAERKAAEEELAKWQKNREDGVKALKERQAFLDKALADLPRVEKAINDAKEELKAAKAQTRKALDALRLNSFLSSDKLDAKLAKYVVLKEAKPKRLAAFAQQGKEQQKLIDDMLDNKDLLVQMLVADGAVDGNYGRAMEIYCDIQKASDKARSGNLQRLALAVALEHARPHGQRNAKANTDAPVTVDPVKRYLHYEKAFLDGELDPAFKDLTVWDYRMVVDGEEPDDILAWGREMLRNYRPDEITTDDYRWRYVGAVRSDIKYGSGENKYDEDNLQFFQNILKNGGVCGRRAFFGRFILRAFGIPTTARPQPGHAALAHWTPDGWVICLGGGWGAGHTKGAYNRDLDFLATTQARAAGEAFMKVKRAEWIGDVVGEPRTWGLLSGKPAFWNSVALYVQRGIIEDSQAKTLAAVGEDIGEANETKEKIDIVKVQISDEDRRIHVDKNGAIIIPAAATITPTKSTGKIIFMDSVLGGKQLHYSRNGGDEDFAYTFDAPAAGKYAMTMKVVTPSWKQKINVIVSGTMPIEMDLPFTVGMWETTKPVEVKLAKGKNVLTFSRSGVQQEVAAKGFSLKQITLTPTGGGR